MNQIIHLLAWEREMEIRREVERHTKNLDRGYEFSPAQEQRSSILSRIFHWPRRRTVTEPCCEGACS